MRPERNLRPLDTSSKDQQQIIRHPDDCAAAVGHKGRQTRVLQRIASGSKELVRHTRTVTNDASAAPSAAVSAISAARRIRSSFERSRKTLCFPTGLEAVALLVIDWPVQITQLRYGHQALLVSPLPRGTIGLV
jgi:hypothetical protein